MADRTRIPHAALMDQVYRRQRYIYDASRKYFLFGRDRLIRDLELGPDEHVVEVGCGTARNLIAIARRYPGARLYGLDASGEMLKTAARHIARAGLGDRIGLAQGYAERLAPAMFGVPTAFDRVIFSYSLSMIPDWYQSLKAAHAVLAPDGRLHVVDFGDLAGLGRPPAWLLRAWLHRFHVEPRSELLRTMEAKLPINTRKNNILSVLPGRYAFVLNCPASDVPRLFGDCCAGGTATADS